MFMFYHFSYFFFDTTYYLDGYSLHAHASIWVDEFMNLQSITKNKAKKEDPKLAVKFEVELGKTAMVLWMRRLGSIGWLKNAFYFI